MPRWNICPRQVGGWQHVLLLWHTQASLCCFPVVFLHHGVVRWRLRRQDRVNDLLVLLPVPCWEDQPVVAGQLQSTTVSKQAKMNQSFCSWHRCSDLSMHSGPPEAFTLYLVLLVHRSFLLLSFLFHFQFLMSLLLGLCTTPKLSLI